MTGEIPTPLTDAFRAVPRGLGTGYYQALDEMAKFERDLTQLRARAERAEGEFKKAVQISVEQAEFALQYKCELEILRAENAELRAKLNDASQP